MLINIDVAEVYDCDNFRIANLLLKNGWILLHSYTRINSVENGIVDSRVMYSLCRPTSVNYSLEMAEKEYKEIFI